MSMPSWTSPRASASTLPISPVIARASSSLRPRMISRARRALQASAADRGGRRRLRIRRPPSVVGGGLALADPADARRGADPRDQGDALHAAAVGLDELPADDLIGGPVGPLGQHVRPQ